MPDIATLGLKVESSTVPQASRELDVLTGAAARAEAAVNDLTTAAAKTGGAHERASASIHRMAGDSKVVGGQISNVTAQLQDIAVMLTSGQSPFLLATQQGTQLSMALGASGGGLRAVMVALGQGFLSLVSPLSLITVGAIAAGAALFQMFQRTETNKTAAKQALQDFDALIERIGKTSEATAEKIKAMLDTPETWARLRADIAETRRTLEGQFTAGVADLSKSLRALDIEGVRARFLAMGDPVARTKMELASLGVELANNRTSAEQVLDRLNELSSAQTTPSSLYNTIAALRVIAKGAIEAKARLDALGGIAVKGDRVGGDPYDDLRSRLQHSNDERNLNARMGVLDFDQLVSDLNDQAKALHDVGRAASGAKSELEKLADKYDGIVDGANRRIASLNAEAEAVGLTAEAAAKLKYQQDLLNQAQQQGITLTPMQTAQLTGLANQMAVVETETAKAREQLEFAKSTTKGFISTLRSGLIEGQGLWEAFGNAVNSVLDKILDRMETQFVDLLFSSSTTGGLGLLGGIGKLLGFSAGGYTGQGPTDRAAGVVHRGEYVMPRGATERIGVSNLDAMRAGAPVRTTSNDNRSTVDVTSDVRVFVDENGNWAAKVEKISQKTTAAAAPKIVSAAGDRVVPTMAMHQQQRAGGEYRFG